MTHPVASPPEREAGSQTTPGLLSRWNIAAGNFFFRYRNTVFPVAFVLIGLLLRPRVILGHPALDRILVACGALIALSGELMRLTTIGFEYIERGGRQGKVYASRLVQGGVYSVSRNPMYVGNALIAIGMSMVCGSPAAYLVVIPTFLYIYQALVSAEEFYLRGRFGREYEAYCARVNRFLPSARSGWGGFAGMRYNWKRALRQDLSTLVGLLLSLSLLPLWRTFFLRGFDAAKAEAPWAAALALLVLLGYGILHRLKKLQRLE